MAGFFSKIGAAVKTAVAKISPAIANVANIAKKVMANPVVSMVAGLIPGGSAVLGIANKAIGLSSKITTSLSTVTKTLAGSPFALGGTVAPPPPVAAPALVFPSAPPKRIDASPSPAVQKFEPSPLVKNVSPVSGGRITTAIATKAPARFAPAKIAMPKTIVQPDVSKRPLALTVTPMKNGTVAVKKNSNPSSIMLEYANNTEVMRSM